MGRLNGQDVAHITGWIVSMAFLYLSFISNL